MIDLITSYLIQEKSCDLAEVGRFVIKTRPAELDFLSKRIFPPQDEVIYSPKSDSISEGLIRYISSKQEISTEETRLQIEEWCQKSKRKIQLFGAVYFTSLGKLQKSVTGSTFFQQDNHLPSYESLIAEKVIHENEAHPMIVGDRETTSSEMKIYLEQEENNKNKKWKWIALILIALAILILFFHFFNSGIENWGNQNQIIP